MLCEKKELAEDNSKIRALFPQCNLCAMDRLDDIAWQQTTQQIKSKYVAIFSNILPFEQISIDTLTDYMWAMEVTGAAVCYLDPNSRARLSVESPIFLGNFFAGNKIQKNLAAWQLGYQLNHIDRSYTMICKKSIVPVILTELYNSINIHLPLSNDANEIAICPLM